MRIQKLLPMGANSLLNTVIDKLTSMVDLAFSGGDATKLAPGTEKRDELTPVTRVAIGQLLKQGRPIPFPWMLAWYRESPNYYLRTPAQRASEEFRTLLAQRVSSAYPDGMPVKTPHARFRPEYRPFDYKHVIALPEFGELPDITGMTEPLAQMHKLVEEVTDALDGYSRFIGRYPEQKDSLAAVHLVPADLVLTAHEQVKSHARKWLEEQIGTRGAIDIDVLALFLLGEKKSPRYSAKDLRRMAEMLALVGHGLEPDPDYSDASLSSGERAWVFQIVGGMARATPTPGYRCAVVLAETLVSIAMADGTISEEEKAAAEQIAPLLRLDEPERLRLQVHIERLCAQRLSFSSLRKKLAALPADMRHTVGRFAITVATADGVLEKAEIRLLEKLYDELEIGRNLLFSDLHAASAQVAQPATEPVVVAQAEVVGARFAIPRSPDAAQAAGPGAPQGLDAARIQRILAETQQVSAVLGRIFQDAEESATISPAGNVETPTETPSPFPGLDVQHAALLQQLAVRAEWTRQEFISLTQTHKLMPDGALETINEWAFDRFDEVLIEEGDSISINRSLLEAA